MAASVVVDIGGTTPPLPVWRALAALCLALVTGLLTLRLIFLPLSATLSPLSLIGLREALTGFFLIYAAYAALTWQRAGARSP